MEPVPRGPEADRYTVLVRGLVLMCSIGIRRSERERRQRVRISVELTATRDAGIPRGDDRRHVINYEKVVAAIRDIAASGHIDLCEGFAARICEACFADPRVAHIRVTVEKLDVFADAEAVGAVLERRRPE
jgi:dihydroneopterin aldolase